MYGSTVQLWKLNTNSCVTARSNDYYYLFMLPLQISTTTSAGEVQGISGSPLKNGSEHLSPASGGSELFPVQEERESFHGEGSVFNVTFSGQFDSKPGMGLEPQAGVKSENGNGPLQATITNSDGTVLFNSQRPA